MNDTKQKRIGKTINRGKKSAKIFILCVVCGVWIGCAICLHFHNFVDISPK